MNFYSRFNVIIFNIVAVQFNLEIDVHERELLKQIVVLLVVFILLISGAGIDADFLDAFAVFFIEVFFAVDFEGTRDLFSFDGLPVDVLEPNMR